VVVGKLVEGSGRAGGGWKEEMGRRRLGGALDLRDQDDDQGQELKSQLFIHCLASTLAMIIKQNPICDIDCGN
jgi:hypothetical protein